jgi:hypothetical protein
LNKAFGNYLVVLGACPKRRDESKPPGNADAVGHPSGIPGFTDYSQPIPPASFSITLGGLTIQTIATVGRLDALIGLEIAGIDNFSLMATGESVSGPDGSFTPDPPVPGGKWARSNRKFRGNLSERVVALTRQRALRMRE